MHFFLLLLILLCLLTAGLLYCCLAARSPRDRQADDEAQLAFLAEYRRKKQGRKSRG